jgi:type IX secretion system PorP/SprF family membrane protein
MKKIAAICFYCIVTVFLVRAQDPMFSQFFYNSLDINPAFAGTANDPRIFLHYRNQWPGAFDKSMITYQGSYDIFIKSASSGFGINLMRDNLYGTALTSSNIDMIYCYRAKISRTFALQSAVQVSFQFENFDANGLTSTDAETLPSNQVTKPDFAVGFLGISRNSQVGLSFHHLNSGYIKFNYNFIKTPLKITFFYTRSFKIYNSDKVQENGFVLAPVLMIQKQAESYNINYGTNFIFNNILAGLWVRNNIPFQFTSIILNAGYTFTNLKMGNLSLGYSYDYEIPSINNFMPVTGAHEITLILTLPNDPKKKRYGPIKCPDML